MLVRFECAINLAQSIGADSFLFEGNEFDTRYACYLAEYLRTKLATDVLEDCRRIIARIMADAVAGRVAWASLPVPKPGAMRAFEGRGNGYFLNVAQANTEEHGVICDGVACFMSSAKVVRLPRAEADQLYHIAAAIQN